MRFGIGDSGWHRELHLRTRPSFGPECQASADRLCTFPDSRQPPMAWKSAFVQHVSIHALSVISDAEAEQSVAITDLGLDSAGARVPKSIPHQLTPNLVELVLENHGQSLRPSLHSHSEDRRVIV